MKPKKKDTEMTDKEREQEELLREALAWLRGGEDRRNSKFSTNYGLIRAISECVNDVREDEA